MVTATARTNSIGQAISGSEGMYGDFGCVTGQFAIEPSDKGSSMFLPDEGFTAIENLDAIHLGQLLNHRDNRIATIAQSLSENKIPLNDEVGVFTMLDDKSELEIRYKCQRFKMLAGRVYMARRIHDD